ncbi:hypothetical protein [Necropsobacter massiliensis]|uniref:hypothetical protein n=1 Tax=Necropsobacter massiliensis TaxID=1400001 RepID=UPI0006608C4A|nr:hypothetical protein [Necropsobacter massiliensis]
MMYKISWIIGCVLALTACQSAQQQPSNAPLDMQTVAQYNAKVYHGNTVTAAQKNQPQVEANMPLNASDYQPKTAVINQPPRLILAPSIGYYHGYRHWHHW